MTVIKFPDKNESSKEREIVNTLKSKMADLLDDFSKLHLLSTYTIASAFLEFLGTLDVGAIIEGDYDDPHILPFVYNHLEELEGLIYEKVESIKKETEK